MTTTSSSQILCHTAAFVSETLSQSELRRHLFSTLRRRLPPPLGSSQTAAIKSLNLAEETLENAIAESSAAVRTSSLRLCEKLLLSGPKSPFSSLLLSLIYGLCRRSIDASVCILEIFRSEPALARTELAPVLFEELFLIHLLPVLQWYNRRRSQILPPLSPNVSYENDDDVSINDMSVAFPAGSNSLSKMSGNQTAGLKELESSYERVLDENCRVFSEYFREVLENKDGGRVIDPPAVVLELSEGSDEFRYDDRSTGEDEAGFENGRYNPIWAEAENSVSVESFSRGSSVRRRPKSPPFYPQRVALDNIITGHKPSWSLGATPNVNSDSELEESSLEDHSLDSSLVSEAEIEENNTRMELFDSRRNQIQKLKQPISAESSRSSPNPLMADSENQSGGGTFTPPKDFVCPITSTLFDDPVTLETGQTYERKAIQEWLDRGNSTCPITRQNLQSTQLPKTNYVLKRLIASWQEQNPGIAFSPSDNPSPQIEPMVKPIMPSTSPVSVISQAAIDSAVSELRIAITNLCMSEILKESEMAVLRIERFWQEANVEWDIQNMLSKPPVINGFVEVLFNSVDPRVLTATVFLLSELGSRDNAVIQTLTQVDSDVECIVALFKKGLMEAVVLIYLLRHCILNLVEMDLVDSLLMVIRKRDDDLANMCLKPKSAAVVLLGHIVGGSESIANTVTSEKALERIISSLESESAEEKTAAIGILLRCMQQDGHCRNTIADKAELAPVLDSFMGAKDEERFEIVLFLSELVKLNRRTFNEQILHIIKDEGPFSTMHTLLIYLQTAAQDHCPVVASLLLQLDLLAEPRKMSIYREEAMDTLISCLRNIEVPAAQIAAAETIMSLQGTFTTSGKPLARAVLLKRAGLDKIYKQRVRMDQLSNFSGEDETVEEEKAADNWERKMAFVLASHEFGLLFEALAEGLKSRISELCSACFVSATWLVHMLNALPDTGIRGAARLCLIKRFISIFKSAKDTEDKALALLALGSFIRDPEGMQELNSCRRDIVKGLRELKRYTPLAFQMLKVFSDGQDSSAELWDHKELVQVDCSENGEVLSVVCFKDKIFSGHSDGTIKVWTGKGSILHLIQEIREHTKAVTSLAILQSKEILYSGSLDRTTRVWSISNEGIQSVEVHDMKDQVHNLAVTNSFSCFIPQSNGIKAHSWSGGSKMLNSSKSVKCFALVNGKIYCGCHDSSVQEIDLVTGTLSTIQTGSRKLLGKSNPIHCIQYHSGMIYAAGSSLDGAAVKIWSAANFSLVGSLSTTLEVRAMAISSELIYLGGKGGCVEIWDREKQNKIIDTLQTGTNCKVLSLAIDPNEEVLVTGTSDGRIQAWGLS
ncbi:putative E3 ubiquitin-protein ligase LIN [Rosa rugosa]|uniref:putative E3 ubiquitin-protein ligase LIN n=1 Tax=Rosa rugosa TaxID=74645 RepID=UPI002B414DFB|nr:putative E3 ubiquitin-protein ligase LIN [Rosa rugosa]